MSDLELEFMCASRVGDRLNVYSHGDEAVFATQDEADGDTSRNVILNTADALKLAIALMDWAREHMPWRGGVDHTGDYIEPAPGHTDLMVSPESLDAWFEDFEPDEMWCAVCGSTLINGECPEKKLLESNIHPTMRPW